MPIVKIPEILRQKLSDNGADALVDLLSEVEKGSRDNAIVLVEEKFERRLSEENAKLDKRITEEIAKLDKRITEIKAELTERITEEIAKLDKGITEIKAELTERIIETKAEIIKWMFLFWVGQVAVVFAIVKFVK